jgi:ABC-2 type transport system ATP-binding protein
MVSTSSGQVIVEAVGLTKVFRDFWMRTKARAVDNVDFVIHGNEIFGLLGPNGSGKSTIIKMVLGLLHKTSGRLSVFGRPPSDVRIKTHIGFLPEESYLYRYLTATETLEYYGKLFGLDARTRRRRIGELLDMVGLAQVAHRPIGEFSKGMTRRIGLAQALINDPQFLILDEPTAGLDPVGTRQVKDVLLELRRRGKTILLSSHLLADVEDVCDRMVMLYGGRIRAQGATDELLRDTQRTVIYTKRLKPETIDRIAQVIRESEHAEIDQIEAPRQRLEQLFLDIVEAARRERVETSGAQHGGTTAAFLRGEAAEGEALIESLVDDHEPVDRAVAVEGDDQEPARPAESDREQDVVAELMAESAPESRDAGSQTDRRPDSDAAEPSRRATTRKDVDESVIDSLLAGEDQPKHDDEPDR